MRGIITTPCTSCVYTCYVKTIERVNVSLNNFVGVIIVVQEELVIAVCNSGIEMEQSILLFLSYFMEFVLIVSEN